MAPSVFANQLRKVVFTNEADHGAVSALYRRTSNAILSSVHSLRFVDLDWDRMDWAQLNTARQLRNLT